MYSVDKDPCKVILFEEDAWIIASCMYNDRLTVYAEHKVGCAYKDADEVWNMDIAYWSWEYTDPEPAKCWECKAEVPANIQGMVKMMNWDKL